MKYVLVQWSSGNIKSSILTENYVRDKSMLYDCTKEGIISFVTVYQGDVSTVKNKGKLGRIACVSDDRKLLEEHQNLLFSEESELIEEDVDCMSLTRSWKRPRLQNGVDDLEDLSSVTGLKLKVSKLVHELSEEKAKVQELQKLNHTLQKSLPEILHNAMQSSKLITQLRTCPNCKQSCGDTEGDTLGTIETGTTITSQDELTTVNSTMVFNTFSNITSEASKVYTSPLNTPTSTPHTCMVASPSIVSVYSNAASPLTPNNDLAITLPSISTSEMDNTLAGISTAESPMSKTEPFFKCPDNKDNTLSPKLDASTAEKLTHPIPLEVTYSGTFKKMTLALLCHLFDKEVLKVSSVTGSGKHQRQALDKNAVQFIIDTVQKRFPDATSKAIKATMAQKCKYLRLPRRKGNAKTAADDKTSES